MYPQRELTRLAARKAALRWDIALRRAQCTEAATRMVRPFEWLDRMLALVRRISPLVKVAAMPLGFLAARTVFPRRKVMGSLARWSPLVLGAVRGICSVFKAPRHDS
jgi:hypothetical protein